MNVPLGIFFALLAMILWGVEEFLLKRAIAGIGSATTFLVNTTAGTFLQILVVVFFLDSAITSLSAPDLALVFAVAILAFFGYITFYRALERQKLSLIASLDESWVIIAVIIAVIVFGETLTSTHIVAILAVLGGAFLVSVDFSRFKEMRFITGSGYEFFSVILIGIVVPLDKLLVTRIGEANTILYHSILILLALFLWKLFVREHFVRPTKRLFVIGALSGIADGLAFIAYILALKAVWVSIVAPIVASTALVAVLLAWIFLRERMAVKQIAGAALILAGVLTLSTVFEF